MLGENRVGDVGDFYLVVEFEQGIVYCEFIALEPFEKVADNGKPVDDRRSHGG